MNVSIIVLIKNNQVIGILQENSDVIEFIENVLDLNIEHMEKEEMFKKINDYVDGFQEIDLKIN